MGCKLPSATIESFEPTVPVVVVEPGPRSAPVEVAAQMGWPCIPEADRPFDPADPTTIPCPPDISDNWVHYLQTVVSLRLPAGLSDSNFVEMMPSFVRSTSAVESVSCSSGLPGAMITFAALTMVESDPDKSLVETRDELLEAFGYTGEMSVCPEMFDVGSGALETVFSIPGGSDNSEPAAALARLVDAGGRRVMVVYEVHPNAWIVMQDTLFASARSLTVAGSP